MAKRKKSKSKKDSMPPSGASDREVPEFWETHSVADYWEELAPAELAPRPKPRQIVTLRLDPDVIQVCAFWHGDVESTIRL